MIVVLFLLYMPMRLFLALFPWIPIPAFRDFVKHPEIVGKWAKYWMYVLSYNLITWIFSLFVEYKWAVAIVWGSALILVLINLVVMRYRVRKFMENGTETESKTDQVL